VQASAGKLPVFLEGDTEPVQHCLERLLASLEQELLKKPDPLQRSLFQR
jgi:hypothetical protein